MVTKTPKPKPYTVAEVHEMQRAGEHFSEAVDSEFCDHAQCWCAAAAEIPRWAWHAEIVALSILACIGVLLFAILVIGWK